MYTSIRRTLSSICLICLPIFYEYKVLFFTILILYPYVIRRLIFRRVPLNCRFENGEIAIVTGSSAGIGTEIATELYGRGAKVIWAARDTCKANSAIECLEYSTNSGPRGYVLHIDLASKKSIEKFVEEFAKRETKLHVLILNAAYHGPRKLTEDGFEQTIGVNHLGHMYLTYLLIKTLKNSTPSRIIVVASDLHRFCRRVLFEDLMYQKGYNDWLAYNHSKLLNILFVKQLSKRLKGLNVTVNAAHPGTPVVTELVRDSWLGAKICQTVFKIFSFLYLRDKKEAAQTAIHCAMSKECAECSGNYFENCRIAVPSKLALNEEVAENLWNISCDLLNIPRQW